MKENNRVLSLLLCIVMAFGMLSAFCLPAQATEAAAPFVIGEANTIAVSTDASTILECTPTATAKYHIYSECGDIRPYVYVSKLVQPEYPEDDPWYSHVDSAGWEYDEVDGYYLDLAVTLYAGETYLFNFFSYSTDGDIVVYAEAMPEATAVEISGPDKAYRFTNYYYEAQAIPEGSAFLDCSIASTNQDVAYSYSSSSYSIEFKKAGTAKINMYADVTDGFLEDSIDVTVYEPDVVDLSVKKILPVVYNEEIHGNIIKLPAREDGYYRFSFSSKDYYSATLYDESRNHIGSAYARVGQDRYFDVKLSSDKTYYLTYYCYDDIEVQQTKSPMPESFGLSGGDSITAYEMSYGDVGYKYLPETSAQVPVKASSSDTNVVDIKSNYNSSSYVYFNKPGKTKINLSSDYCSATGTVDVKVIPAENITLNQEYTFDFTKAFNQKSVIKFTPAETKTYTFKFDSKAYVSADLFNSAREYLEFDIDNKITSYLQQGQTYYVVVSGSKEYSVIVKETVAPTGIQFDKGEEIYIGEGDGFRLETSTVPFNSHDMDIEVSYDTEEYIRTSVSGSALVAYKAGTFNANATTGGTEPLTAKSKITVTPAQELECGQKVTKSFGENTLSYAYSFTAKEDDDYAIICNSDDDIMIMSGGEYYYYSAPNVFKTVHLNKGETFGFIVKDREGDAWSYELSVQKCKDVTSLKIPDRYSSFDWKSVNSLYSLTGIEISENNSGMMVENGLVYSKDKKEMIYCPVGKSGKISIADTAETIRRDAFSSCADVTEVEIPDTVKEIGLCAFENSGIKKVNIPSSVTSIAYGTFQGCNDLKEVSLPKTVKTIEANAFNDCDSLTDIKYEGSKEEFELIKVKVGNDAFLNANISYAVNICEHKYDNACDTTCNKCSESRVTSHVYDNACDTGCNICGGTRKTTHSFGDYVSDKNATTEKDGTKTRTCSVCGTKDTVTDAGTKLVEIKDTTKIFTDVKAKKWYTNAVNYAYSHGFIAGVSDTEFGRDVPVTRGMFITILARIAGVDTSSKANKVTTKFTDVKSGKYYTNAIKWASENGVVSGLTDTTFGPSVSIERQQLCTMIINFAKYMEIELPETQKEIKFKDATSIRKYAKKAVAACQKAGVVSGYSVDGGTEFKPLNTATRAEAAQILYKFHKDFVAK